MQTQPIIALDLPPLYESASASSGRAQRLFFAATATRLIALVCAAFLGMFTWKYSDSMLDWAGLLAAGAFSFALIAELYLRRVQPERTWYEGRAAAESVKTLSWRFAVGGKPFAVDSGQERLSEESFLRQLRSVLEGLKGLDLVPPTSSEEQITATMRAARSMSLSDRQKLYEIGRVEDQQTWYRQKAVLNNAKTSFWTIVLLVAEASGLVGALLKAVGHVQIDVLGFTGAVVAAMTAWLQAKQHRNLAVAYTVTALDLALLRSSLHHKANEDEWSSFVDDAEEAFSREHTLWKASRSTT